MTVEIAYYKVLLLVLFFSASIVCQAQNNNWRPLENRKTQDAGVSNRTPNFNNRPPRTQSNPSFANRQPQPVRPVPYVCLWSEIPMRDAPGENSTYIQSLYFGQEVSPTNRRTEPRNGRYYIQIQTSNRKIGWVEENTLARDGGAIALIQNAPIYDAVNGRLTTQQFYLGETAILTDFREQGGWVQLIAPDRRKIGWIQGVEKVSIDELDIQLALLLYRANVDPNPQSRLQKLQNIRNVSGYRNSPIFQIVENQIANSSQVAYNPDRGEPQYRPQPQPQPNPGYTPPATYNPNPNPTTPNPNPSPAPTTRSPNQPGMFLEKVVDSQTGQYYNRVTEVGGIQAVKGPRNPKSIYFAYHKTRPLGSKILIQRPDGSYVQLEIVNRLKKSNANIIGLGEAAMKEIYGPQFSKTATITYPQ